MVGYRVRPSRFPVRCRRVALGIKVDEQGRAMGEGETSRKIHGCGGLADPAFLIHHRDRLANRLAFGSDLAALAPAATTFLKCRLCGTRDQGGIIPQGWGRPAGSRPGSGDQCSTSQILPIVWWVLKCSTFHTE